MTEQQNISRVQQVSRRTFLKISGGLAGTVALAACSPSNPAPAPTVAPVATAAPADSAAATATPAPAQEAGEVVIALTGENIPEEPMTLMSEAFQDTIPGVEIAWEFPNLGAGDYPQWLGTQVAAGNIRPDVVSGNYLSSYNGYVNLDQYRKTTNPFTGNAWDQDIQWEALRGKNNKGERIMVHMRSVHTYWFYNQEIFDKISAAPPTTWDEFLAVNDALLTAGHTPMSVNYIWQAPQWLAEIYFDQYHVNWVEEVRAQPGDWNFEPDKDGVFDFDPKDPFIHEKYTYNIQRFFNGIQQGTLRFDTAEVADLANNMAKMFPEYATEDFFVISDAYAPFLQQQTAIMSNGTWSIPTMLRDMESISPERLEQLKIETDISPFAWSTFENPSMMTSLVQTSAKAVESAPGPYLSIINKNQEQVDRALAFVMFFSTAPGFSLWNEGLRQANEFSPAGPLLVNNMQDPPEIQALWDQLTFTGNAETNYNGFWTSAGGGDFQTDLRNMFKDVLEETITPDQYATQLQAYITDNLQGIVERSNLSMDDISNPAREPGV
ncbi:MAG: extracellular solute-binding protein [Caldilineaceae bacterium]|nr:extracellular solute-binding protein [Caldilineaceae bacterium]